MIPPTRNIATQRQSRLNLRTDNFALFSSPPSISSPTTSLAPSSFRCSFSYILYCIIIICLLFEGYVVYKYYQEKPNNSNLKKNDNIKNHDSITSKFPFLSIADIFPSDSSVDRFDHELDNDSTIYGNTRNNSENTYSNDVVEKWSLSKDKCDAYFGHGFSNQFIHCSSSHLLSSSSSKIESSFTCYQNPTSQAIYCTSKNLIIDLSNIDVSNGGEDIASVSNRKEDDEFPKYKPSAFIIGCPLTINNIPSRERHSFYLHDVINKVAYDQNFLNLYESHCLNNNNNNNKIIIYALLTTRYEYANLYHTGTDWYNFYQIIHIYGLPKYSFEVIFLDGHSWGALDDTWNRTYGKNYKHIKQVNNNNNKNNIICIENSLFIPAGYTGGISLQTMERSSCESENKYVVDFGVWFLKGYNIDNVSNRKNNVITISLICRKDYLAHPRNMAKRTSRKFANDNEVENTIKSSVKEYSDKNIIINVNRVYLEDLTIKEQLKIISKTDILIGVHGAGLTHVLFLPKKSGVIEIVPNGYSARRHFYYLSKWCGHYYYTISGGSDHSVQINEAQLKTNIQNVISKLIQS